MELLKDNNSIFNKMLNVMFIGFNKDVLKKMKKK